MLILLYFILFCALMRQYFLLTLNCCWKEAVSSIDPENLINMFRRVTHVLGLLYSRGANDTEVRNLSLEKSWFLFFIFFFKIVNSELVWFTKVKSIKPEYFFIVALFILVYYNSNSKHIVNYCSHYYYKYIKLYIYIFS